MASVESLVDVEEVLATNNALFQSLWEAVGEEDAVKMGELIAEIVNSKDATVPMTVFRSRADDGGEQTILHHAVSTKNTEVVWQLLAAIRELDAELANELTWTKDGGGLTPVHLAVQTNQASVVSILLGHHGVDGDLAVGRRRSRSVCSLHSIGIDSSFENHPELIMLALSVSPEMAGLILKYFKGNPASLCSDFCEKIGFEFRPMRLESTVPLVFVGDKGAGKSSLIRSLQIEGALPWLKYYILNVPGADTHTAGIIPTHFESIWFGKVVFFDLSSHREFVHEAILNCGSLVDAVFLIVVNLSNSIKKITQQIIYWLEFVRYHYSKVSSHPPTVIIVGSHLGNLKLGAFINRERFRIHSLPTAMENIDQSNFTIGGKIEMDCRNTGPENAILRWAIIAQCDLIRQNKNHSPLPSKTYILHAIIEKLVNDQSEVKAITMAELLEELRSPKIHCQLFEETEEEVKGLCKRLNELNLLLILEDNDSTWIVPDSYPFLCQIEEVIFSQIDDQAAPDVADEDPNAPDINGVLMDSKLQEKFSRAYPQASTDLFILLMIHYKYCEEVTTRDNQKGYFFPHLLKPLLDIPSWEDVEKNRFMFAWTIAPESRYHYFMPHLVHHFLLQLPQELGITKVERATRTLAWSDPNGVEVVVHIHSSQRLLVSMRSMPNRQLECLKLRNPVLKRIKEILKLLNPVDSDDNMVEAFIPEQKRVTLPYTSEDPTKRGRIRLYQMDRIKTAIINREAGIQPSNHATPLITVDDLLFFEPYYYIGNVIRERLYESSEENITEEDYYDIGMNLGPTKLRLLDKLLDNVEHPITDIPLQDQLRESYLRLMAKHGQLTYRQFRQVLDSISFIKLEDIISSLSSNVEDESDDSH